MRLNTAAAILAATTLLGACAHHDTVAVSDSDYGRVEPAVITTSDTQVAVIPGPAKIDDTGAVFTSSSAGGAGNAANLGTNTNVNVVPQPIKVDSTVTYSPVEPIVVETAVVVPVPAPALIVEVPEVPAPAVIVETETIVPETMVSATEETTTPTRRRMSKD